MDKKLTKIKNIILPSKKTNYFIITILILGLISGSVFLMVLNETDKTSVLNQIQTFFTNIDTSNINSGLAFKNSIITNIIYITLIWILGMSIIGIFINIFLVYLKGFLLGFSIASIFSCYGFKGVIGVFIYIFPHQLLNIFCIIILGIYSIMFTVKLFEYIMGKKNNNMRNMLKKYTIIYIFTIITSLLSSLSEAYLLPALMKLVIKLFI